MKFICFHLHDKAKNAKRNENAKKKKKDVIYTKKGRRIFSKTNEDAEKKTKTQIIG